MSDCFKIKDHERFIDSGGLESCEAQAPPSLREVHYVVFIVGLHAALLAGLFLGSQKPPRTIIEPPRRVIIEVLPPKATPPPPSPEPDPPALDFRRSQETSTLLLGCREASVWTWSPEPEKAYKVGHSERTQVDLRKDDSSEEVCSEASEVLLVHSDGRGSFWQDVQSSSRWRTYR